jgi:Family of unknown function (DUF6262)
MSRADNTRYLRVAAQARHDHALQRAHDAIRTLDRHGEPITFTSVAATAGVSRPWLYRQPDLRALIARHASSRPTSIPAAQRATAESNAARLDALRLEIEHLRTENAALRDHVSRALGQRRAHPDPLRQQHVHNADPQPAPNLTVPRSR